MARLTHDERRRRQKTRDAAGIIRVTWRRVSEMTGGGYSGFGPRGLDGLVYVVRRDWPEHHFEYGNVVPGVGRVRSGSRPTVAEAKAAAEALFENPPTEKED